MKFFQDVGSGQGHLARFLAYNYGLSVTAIESVGEHLAAAAKFDGWGQVSLLPCTTVWQAWVQALYYKA